MSVIDAEGNVQTIGRNSAPCIRPLAHPPKFLLGPVSMTVAHDMMALLGAMLLISVWDWSAFTIFSPIIGHVVLVAIGLREPQIDNLIMARYGSFGLKIPSPTRGQKDRQREEVVWTLNASA